MSLAKVAAGNPIRHQYRLPNTNHVGLTLRNESRITSTWTSDKHSTATLPIKIKMKALSALVFSKTKFCICILLKKQQGLCRGKTYKSYDSKIS
jgi:hypothetical protein